MTDVHYLLLSAALTWFMITIAAQLRMPAWTPTGSKLAFGNRDALPEPSAIAARADRATKNMLENMVLFIAVIVAARAANAHATTGAAIFFFARLAYFVVYLAGIKYVRTLIWLVSLLGIWHIGLAAAGIL